MTDVQQTVASPPEVVHQLASIVQVPSVDSAIQRLVRFPLKGADNKSLLPAPWHLAMQPSLFVFAQVRSGRVESVSCVRVDDLISDEFLAALTPMIPAKTELWWTSTAGVEFLRTAFVEAFRLQKLVRVRSSSRSVLLEWPYYGLRFWLDGLDDLPRLLAE